MNYRFNYRIIKDGNVIKDGMKGIPEICAYLNDEVYNNDFYTKFMISNYFNKKGKHQHGFRNIRIERDEFSN